MARGKIEKRGQRRRKIKPVILIVTEGSQTEPKYFEHYRNRQTNIDIRVVGSRTSGGETDYLSLIRKAVEYQNKNQISVSEGDSVSVSYTHLDVYKRQAQRNTLPEYLHVLCVPKSRRIAEPIPAEFVAGDHWKL